jgi:NAD(P)-dependent dehydrogenase (short-subunit alcohol dehydrogenase family)
MVEALIARGSHVIAIARNRVALNEIERLGANVIAGDVTEASFMDRVVVEQRPSVLILNAGAPLDMGPIDTLSFERFSRNWNVDVKAGLHGIQAALKTPMGAGSRVLIMSSGAAMVLSAPHIPPQSLRLSGGYIGAKRMLWFMAHSANATAKERGLQVHFQVLAPTQLMGGTSLGRDVASEYAKLENLTVEEYLFKRYGPPLEPRHVGEQVAEILANPKYATGVAYGLRTGPEPIALDV